MITLSFAQLSDIHINQVEGNHHDVLGAETAGWLTQIVRQLNQHPELDFVLVTGDLVDNALPSEFDQFQEIMSHLTQPYFVIPGNHDRVAPSADLKGLTRYQFAQRFNPQIADRPADGLTQAGYWSIAVHDQVQVIGLDSIRDADWGGIIDPPQLAWLEQELAQHKDKLVIVMIHHPLHALAPIDHEADWRNFLCDNAAEVLAVFDRHPQVKLVLTAHHHFTKADLLGARLHLAAPALAVYPCAYRTFTLTYDGSWRITWHTHPATDEATLAQAHQLVLTGWQAVGFSVDYVKEHIAIAYGTPFDRQGSIELT